MNPTQQKHITDTVADVLNEHYNGAAQFDAIHAVPDTDFVTGDDLVQIVVVFSEDNPTLMSGAKTKITLRLLDYLHAESLPHFPVTYFIGKSDWPKFEEWLSYATP